MSISGVTSLLVVSYAFLLSASAVDQTPLQFGDPWDVSIADSIPGDAGEKIVLSYKGPNVSLQAHWVVILVNLPYEQTRIEIRELLHKTFGIESEREILAGVEAARQFNANMPSEPLYGDGFSDFHVVGVSISEAREYRIQSKSYNKSWWNNYSKSQWRIIDGNRLFDKACSLVVVSRTDRSREWFVLHPGIPLPFKVSGETTLVTDTETEVIETLLKNKKPSVVRYFVPHTGYKTKGVLNMMTAIRDAAKELPAPK